MIRSRLVRKYVDDNKLEAIGEYKVADISTEEELQEAADEA